MRRCPQCGAETPDQARFCGNCGSTLVPMQAPVRLPAPKSAYPLPRQEEQRQAVFPPSQGKIVAPPAFPSAPPQMSGQPFYQPYKGETTRAPRAKRSRRVIIWACIGIVIAIMLAIAGAFLLLSANSHPQLSLMQGQPVPGQQIVLLGEHFPAGSRMSIVVDSRPLLLSMGRTSLFTLEDSLVPISKMGEQGIIYRVVVGTDGTFTIKIRIPLNWTVGSEHTIVAQLVGANPVANGSEKVQPVQYQFAVVSSGG